MNSKKRERLIVYRILNPFKYALFRSTEKLGYAMSEPVPENKVTWGFTYMNSEFVLF